MKIDAIIFDFDGVLAESVDVKTKAFAKIFEPYGTEIVDKVVEHHESNGGISRFDKFRLYFSSFLNQTLDEKKLDELCQQFSRIVVDQVIKADYVEGAAKLLNEYLGRYDLFVASATPQQEIEFIVKQRGMTRYFKGIYGSPRKKALLIHDIIDSYAYDANAVVFVGDAINDYDAAHEAGCRFVGRVVPGSTSPFPAGTETVNDLSQLRSIIDRYEEA